MESNLLIVDGESLTVEKLMSVNMDTKIDLAEDSWNKIRASRKVIDDIVARKEIVYGVNTGFGNFSNVVISEDKLEALQYNLIRSHSAGVGNLLSIDRVKRLLTLRLNVFAKGFSGIGEETVRRIIEFYNQNCLSAVPEQGTVGASGDLAPLAHLVLGFIGEGKMWNPKKNCYEPAQNVIDEFGLKTIQLKAKEGLALINGTQMITALAAEALHRSINIAHCANLICAISLEALDGNTNAFDERIHLARPHKGQIKAAKLIRCLSHGEKYKSEIYQNRIETKRVQDAYSLRCSPQVHGVVYDTISFVKGIIETEMNSATDNPMVFSETDSTVSGGNFHGEFPAKACDYLAIAIHELSNISERRIERLCNGDLSGLPPFLVKEGGLNSGFMIAHCTAAALVSENKTLCHPSSVDSISTSAAKEDHVSMGGWSARKCLRVVENVEKVLAIEYLAACQGIDFMRPDKSTEPIEALHILLREHVDHWDEDRVMCEDIEKAWLLIKEKKLLDVVNPFIELDGL